MTNESQPAAKGGEQVLTVGVAQFRAALALYPAEDQEILEWLRGYLYQALGGQVQPLLQRLGVSYLDLHRVFSGRRSENYSGVIAAAAALRQRVAKDTPLVETDVTRAITDALDYARDHAAMTAIVGGTGRGKTLTAQVWAAANNHGRTHYIRMTSGARRSTLLMKLCESAGMGYGGYKGPELEQRILHNHAYTSRHVLIIDEAGHLIPKGDSSATSAIEFLRDMHDEIGCAVVLIFTDVYLEQMEQGRLNRFFGQFIGRLEKIVRIAPEPSLEEVEAAVRSFAPEAGSDLIAAAFAATSSGKGKLRTLYRDLKKADLLAKAQNHPLDVEDLKAAIAWRSGEEF